MIENSPIFHKTISRSLQKLQRVASDGKFRMKSIRVKTTSNEMEEHITSKLGLPLIYPNQSQKKLTFTSGNPLASPAKGVNSSTVKPRTMSYKIVQKNYEQELNDLGADSQYLRELFAVKSEQAETKTSEQRYQIFVKNLALRLHGNKYLNVGQMGLGPLALQLFFKWYIDWHGHITELDLSNCCEILKERKLDILKQLLEGDWKLMKLVLCNSALNGEEIQSLLTIINEKQQLFALDLSNNNSQTLNRFGEETNVLEDFVRQNQSVAILKLNNLQLKRDGFECIWKGVATRKINPIRILSLASNYIGGGKLSEAFYGLLRSGLINMDLSCNPLGEDFYKNLPTLKSTTIRQLNLGETNMNSECLYDFLERIEESKSLSILKLDRNDFSHHWFGKIGQKLQTNNSLELLTLNNCQIKTFTPIFQGLTMNKYLKKLEANNNTVDYEPQMLHKITDCFLYNKDLEEFKVKFCNLSEDTLIKICEGLAVNKKVKILDISENLLEDSGARAIMKMLEENTRIQYVGIEKVQISQQMRRVIQLKLQENKQIRETNDLITLKKATVDLKQKDNATWEDVERFEEEERNLVKKAKTLQEKIGKLQIMATSRRQILGDLVRKCKQEQRDIEQLMKEKIRYQNQRVGNHQREAKKLEQEEERHRKEMEKEKETILVLQTKIRLTNQHIKRRENELEDMLRNHKYMQRKKGSRPQQTLSPRKSSGGHNHLHPSKQLN